MTGTFYKGLGFAVWWGARRYMRHRWGGRPRRIGMGLIGAALAAGAAAAARRRMGGGAPA